MADCVYVEGSFGATGGNVFHVVTGQPLLDDSRRGEFSCRCDVDDGEEFHTDVIFSQNALRREQRHHTGQLG